MAVTLEELKEKLKARVDEITLLEILEISSEELVDRFEDFIENKFDKLVAEVGGEDEQFGD